MRSILSIHARAWTRAFLGLVALVVALSASSAHAQQVVISQIYGGGGGTGATFNRDYVELHNRGSTSQDLTGWSVQYAASTGSSWSRRDLVGAIPAGGYFLIAMTSTGTIGAAVPADQTAGTAIDMAAAAGKVALVGSITTLPAIPGIPQGTNALIDFVGYGQAAVTAGQAGYEGRGSAPALTVTTAAFRANNGCSETHDNLVDFTAALPAPRNLSTAANICVGMGACCTGSGGVYTTSAACTGAYQGDWSTLGTVTYTSSTGMTPMEDITSTGQLLPADGFDDSALNFTLAVPILLFGQPRTILSVGSNGLLSGLPGTSATSRFNVAIPTAASPNDIIAPLWMDLIVRTAVLPNAHMYIQQKTGPNRIIVQWNHVSTFTSGSATPDDFTFQAILYQATGAVEYRYGAMITSISTPPAEIPSIGIENQSGTIGTQVPTPSYALLSGTSVLLTPVNSGACGPTSPPSAFGFATPNPVLQGNTTVLTAQVFPTPGSSGVSVVGNLTSIGGPASVTFLDNGVSPDAVAGDNIFSTQITISGSFTPGIYTVPLTITDAQGGFGTSFITVQVNAPPPPNDTCGTAIALSLDLPLAGTTAGAANDYQLPAASPAFTGIGQTANTAPGNDVVYSFVAPRTGAYSFRVTNYAAAQNVTIYTTSSCQTGTAPITVSTAIGAANRSLTNGEEIVCQAMTTGQQVYVYVDNVTGGNLGSAFVVEVNCCVPEVEPNGTTATANNYVYPTTGAINSANEADFYSLGTPAAGSRVFAFLDGSAGGSTNDWQMRVTTAVDTLEFDDDDGDVLFGVSGFEPAISGTPLTGVQSYLRINPFSTTLLTEPYRLYAVVRPPIASAAVEVESNDTPGTAGSQGNYISGALATTADVDHYSFTATAGQLIYVGLDLDPLRNNTPITSGLALLDGGGAVLAAVLDPATTTSTVASPGTLTGSTPTSKAEAIVWRVRTTGTYIARVNGTVAGDYLLSIHVQYTPDVDSDNVQDCVDNCPTVANTTQVNADADLFGDACDNCPGTPNDNQANGDGDLLGDACDGCPIDPLKTAPGQCGCGIADTDSDLDGTADCNDGCPTDPLKIAPGQCGCNFADTDTDLDGTADCNDGCPTDPLKIAPGQCGCNVADTDTDNDGTANCNDGCPTDPLKIAPGVCGCNVADTDTDLDGTPNCNDGCPTDPLKIAPGQCGCNVADTDTDSDGIANCIDNCPAVPNAGQQDIDMDGRGDLCDNCVAIANPGQGDCDTNGIGDACEIAAGALDCNMNGIPDTCDITSATSADANANGIPDECELNGGTPFCFGYVGCPCGNNSTVGSNQGCRHNATTGAALTGSGLTDVSTDGLVLTVNNLPLPPLGAGRVLFFQGTAPNNVTFNDGIRCVGGTQVRLGNKAFLGTTSSYPQMGDPSVSVKGGVPATGGPRYYQAWYRNVPGMCGTLSNLSNGLSVVWVP